MLILMNVDFDVDVDATDVDVLYVNDYFVRMVLLDVWNNRMWLDV